MDGIVAVRVRDVLLRRGARLILDHVGFDVPRGEVVALMGASGSGKTTMLRVMAGLEPFESGLVEVEGVAVPPNAPSTDTLIGLRKNVGMVFQSHALFEHLPVLQNVTLALIHVHRVARSAAEERARSLLTSLGVAHRIAALPRELSGGEAQRVAIARALASDPPVLLMDEPTASLDPSRRRELGELVLSLAGRDRTLVVVTHDDDFAEQVASRRLMMAEGRVTCAAAALHRV